MSASLNNTSTPSHSDDPTSGADAAIAIVSVVVGGVVIIAMTILIIRCVQKRRKQPKNMAMLTASGAITTTPLRSAMGVESMVDMASVERFLDDIMKEKPIRFSPQHLIDFTHKYAEKLGSGGFGEVYKGQLPTGVQIAVKVLHKTLDKRAEDQFMAEVATIGRTYHINLVRLYGFCFDATLKALVYEYMEKGSLDYYLFNDEDKLSYEKLHEITVGTAKGIRYLHEECEKKIVHYDIKPANVLLGPNFHPKVADFGLAKLCERDNSRVTNTGGRGTPGYAAPELWMPFPVTEKCDVYSYGMLLFEILGRRRNLDFQQVESQEWFPRWIWNQFEQGELKSVVSFCGVEEKDREKAERMCKVALWCVQYQQETRPSMNSVVRMLEGEEEIIAPLNPFQYLMPHDVSSSQWTESTRDSTNLLTSSQNSIQTVRNESEMSSSS